MRWIVGAGFVLIAVSCVNFFMNERILIRFEQQSPGDDDDNNNTPVIQRPSSSQYESIVQLPKRDARNFRLEFVHIPKTGGTAIETAAANMNITWSLCHFVGSALSVKISDNITKCPDAPSTRLKKPKTYQKVPHWHLPPRYLGIPGWYLHNPYENATLFTVVRNPYERIVSQSKEMMNDPVFMNEWINKSLAPLELAGRAIVGDPGLNDNNNATVVFAEPAYYVQLGHLIPQYDFVYDGHERVIEHVLHFERLHDEFPLLMKEYGLDFIRLPEKGNGPGRMNHAKEIGVANLTLSNVRLIESVYARDFAAFGYEAISHRLENSYYNYRASWISSTQ
ncbi:MAG: hypothetical protein SGARI_006163 [Bacillariaceae sp.]